VHVKSIADTSNFDDFPEIEESHSFENEKNGEKDWVFQNYTFKRFEGLTQRGLLRMSNQ
jgi:serine/threonine kinase 38